MVCVVGSLLSLCIHSCIVVIAIGLFDTGALCGGVPRAQLQALMRIH